MPIQLPQINLVNVDQRKSIDSALDALAEGSTRSPRALLSPRPESMRLHSPRMSSPREDERDRKSRRASLNLQDLDVLPPLSPRGEVTVTVDDVYDRQHSKKPVQCKRENHLSHRRTIRTRTAMHTEIHTETLIETLIETRIEIPTETITKTLIGNTPLAHRERIRAHY